MQLANTLTDSNDLVCHILHDLGSAYRETGDLIQANKFFQESIELAEKEQNLSIIALVYNSLGSLYYKLKDTNQAIIAYEKSLSCLEQLQDKFKPAQVYNNLGLVHIDLHDWQKSEYFFQQSLEIKCQAGDMRGQAITLTNLVTVYLNSDRQLSAVEHLQQAIKIFDELYDLYNLALAKRRLAKLYHSRKNLDLSRQTFTEAIELFNRCHRNEESIDTSKELATLFRKERIPGWIRNILVVISLIAIIPIIIYIEDFTPSSYLLYIRKGDKNYESAQYEQAIDAYSKAIKIDSNKISAYIKRGDTYVKLEQYDQALADYTKVEEIDLYEFYFENRVLEKRGRIYHLQGDREKAEADYTTSLLVSEKNLFSLVSLGIISYQEDKLERSKEYFQQALDFAQKESLQETDLHYVAISRLVIGQTEEALKIYHQIKNEVGTDDALKNLSFLKQSLHPPVGVDESIKILTSK